MRNYVLTWAGGQPIIYGPFKDEKAAARYGAKWQALNNDNPCWNTVCSARAIHIPRSE